MDDAADGRPDDGNRAVDRTILAIALPALGALIAEPLFLLADSAIVGRLGTTALAGLGVGGTVLTTVVQVFVFLAYGTTAGVARLIGAGERPGAIALGLDAAWLAAGLGTLLAVLGLPLAPLLTGAFGADPAVTAAATRYLRWSLPGVPAMLVVLALIGVLRGLQRTRATLAIAAAGAVVNALLNLLLVHGVGWGIAGSAIGTSITQCGMAAAAVGIVISAARAGAVRLRPHGLRVRAVGRAGVPLLIRTLAMRAVLVLATAVAARLGPAVLAAHQVAVTVWVLLALALDAVAIAGQTLTGGALGASDIAGVRAATRRMIRWGLLGGAALGLVLLACAGPLGPLFSADPHVRAALAGALVVAAVAQPLAGYVFVLDGVLIGAGDGPFLARAAVLQAGCFVPVALAVGRWAPSGTVGLMLLWTAFAGGWMALRAVQLGRRARGTSWIVTGAVR